jgi:hypothetical protein
MKVAAYHFQDKAERTTHALKPSRLAVGHGPMLGNPIPAMQEAIARAERKFHDQA